MFILSQSHVAESWARRPFPGDSQGALPLCGEAWRGDAPPNLFHNDKNMYSYKPIPKPFAKTNKYKIRRKKAAAFATASCSVFYARSI